MRTVVIPTKSDKSAANRLVLPPQLRQETNSTMPSAPVAGAPPVGSQVAGVAQEPWLRLLFGAMARDGLAEHGRQTHDGLAELGTRASDGLVKGMALVAGAIIVAALVSHR